MDVLGDERGQLLGPLFAERGYEQGARVLGHDVVSPGNGCRVHLQLPDGDDDEPDT